MKAQTRTHTYQNIIICVNVCVCIKITAGENTHVCGKQMQLEKKGEKKGKGAQK